MGFVNMSSPEMRPREFRPSSESFFAAMQRYGGVEEGEGSRKVSVIGANVMQAVMRFRNGIPSQAHSFEVDFSDDTSGNRTNHNTHLVTGVEKGLVAGEFMRSRDFGLKNQERTVTIKQGRGIVMLQRHASDTSSNIAPDVVEEFKAVKVSAGEQILIPPGYFYALVNTNNDAVLVAQHNGSRIEDDGNPNSQGLRDMHGFAFRVVAVDSHVCLERNTNYKEVKTCNNGGMLFSDQNLD